MNFYDIQCFAATSFSISHPHESSTTAALMRAAILLSTEKPCIRSFFEIEKNEKCVILVRLINIL